MRMLSCLRWPAAVLAVLSLFTLTVPLATAAPEADDGFYLDVLNGLAVYDRYSKETLLQEGHKVCGAMKNGASEDIATQMVESDLGTKTYDAYRIVTAVELGLDCFAPKVHGQ